MKTKKRNRRSPQTPREYCRQIFGNAKSPNHVWEQEFDYCDEELRKLAHKNWQDITSKDLGSFYVLNLVYVEPLQPELFNYLFPICLDVWREELIENKTSYFGEEVYRAFSRPYLWQEMMNSWQREAVYRFIVDSMIERLELESGFIYK